MEKDNKDKKKNKIKWEIKKANYISDAVAVRVREKKIEEFLQIHLLSRPYRLGRLEQVLNILTCYLIRPMIFIY